MTDTRPAPLVPAEVNLQDFPFMPLDVARLRDSDLASDETPEACWAAVLIWCASWHQVPAGSIPDNDEWQAKQAGYKAQGRVAPGWRKVRAGALRGWVLCSDGRLYHPVIAEKAVDAWRSKLKQRWFTECGRIKKHNQRHGTTVSLPELDAWISLGCPQGHALPVPEDKPPVSLESPPEIHSKRQGEGQGQGQGIKEERHTSAEPTPEPTPTIPCPYGGIVDAYHLALPSLPAVRLRDGPTWVKRQKAMRTLWGWVLSSRKSDGTPRAETAEQALAWVAGYFRRASENDFVMGRTKRSAEHENWTADFDFLLSEKGMRQVIEKTQDKDKAA
jgi:hypothetical protein